MLAPKKWKTSVQQWGRNNKVEEEGGRVDALSK
jgi:hypothetical protein